MCEKKSSLLAFRLKQLNVASKRAIVVSSRTSSVDTEMLWHKKRLAQRDGSSADSVSDIARPAPRGLLITLVGVERVELLNLLSSYDHTVSFQQLRCQRCVGTAEWLIERPEIIEWLNSPTTAVIWLSGKRKELKRKPCASES